MSEFKELEECKKELERYKNLNQELSNRLVKILNYARFCSDPLGAGEERNDIYINIKKLSQGR